MRFILFVAFSTLLLVGCTEKKDLEKEVLDIHDLVMAKLGSLQATKKNLKNLIATTENEDVKIQAHQLITRLEEVDESMMLWMENWHVPADETQKKEYLLQEKAKMEEIGKRLEEVLKISGVFLNE